MPAFLTAPIIVVIGVSGSGKTTFAKHLAAITERTFLDADDFHPQDNIIKMSVGDALTDIDRAGWLKALNERLKCAVEQIDPVVLACSALKSRYRRALEDGLPSVDWIWLDVETAELERRLAERENHFAGPSLLESQLATFEPPRQALRLIPQEARDASVESLQKLAAQRL